MVALWLASLWLADPWLSRKLARIAGTNGWLIWLLAAVAVESGQRGCRCSSARPLACDATAGVPPNTAPHDNFGGPPRCVEDVRPMVSAAIIESPAASQLHSAMSHHVAFRHRGEDRAAGL